MSDFIIYHNPRCSKSRQTLEILNQQEVDTEIVLYLENPPSAEEVASILEKLGLSSRDIIRKGEEEDLGNAEIGKRALIIRDLNRERMKIKNVDV